MSAARGRSTACFASGVHTGGVRLTVLDETSSGEHKFKLTALFLNQLGGKDMFGGWTAKNALFSKEEAAKREAKEAAKVSSSAGRPTA